MAHYSDRGSQSGPGSGDGGGYSYADSGEIGRHIDTAHCRSEQFERLITILDRGQQRRAICRLDTGADVNFISQSAVNYLGLGGYMRNLHEPLTVQLIGERVHIQKVCQLEYTVNNIQRSEVQLLGGYVSTRTQECCWLIRAKVEDIPETKGKVKITLAIWARDKAKIAMAIRARYKVKAIRAKYKVKITLDIEAKNRAKIPIAI
ncbi:hypothetical protein GP486_002346 [Trichoglossum hirsutum]|uniref:Uncharacterized protein n=1 Tax=Trichoglossum hirsutum TaxID=265104 RepID=A0A9P8RRT0_9PEZI|nr:hypothetical protein GP486_002346 [Trichoglossum hirsutum]